MAESIQNTIDFLQETQDTMMEDYKALLRFPSISADPAHAGDVSACADWIVGQLKALGFDNCEAIATAGHPVVYGEWLKAGADKPTALVYAHYDVQPVDPLPLWETEPFEGVIKERRMFARGASDNKAGVWGNLKVFEALLRTNGELPVNVKIMFEGEEESGSPSIEAFVKANKARLKADVLLNCDGDLSPDSPKYHYGGRGMVTAEVRVSGPSADLHSGLYGGLVENPLHVAGRIIGSFHDRAGRIQVPGFYDDLREAGETEKARIQAGFQAEALLGGAGVDRFWGDSIAPVAERATVYPTCDITGMWGGYQGPGNKTIIPAEAGFKVTMRLAPDQDPSAISGALKAYVEGFSTDTVQVDCQLGEEAWYFELVTEGAWLEAVQSAIEATIGKRAQLVRTGGSIPMLGVFNRLIGLPITAFAYGEGEGIHSPNEYLKLDSFYTSLEAAVRLYHNLGAVEA
ncbi:MAG: M20/M25/M40 family metallo-hydrolase [Chloroflexota bacterium]|nr:M20/M25/M40 family metallo-hydrolase [Chloroflexota bacterium]MDE2945976.1 M20/M25/M40 family metallo-hydrolase [Chloroflexota bacterium]